MSATMLSGAVGGEKRATGWPARSTSHFVKFHLTWRVRRGEIELATWMAPG